MIGMPGLDPADPLVLAGGKKGAQGGPLHPQRNGVRDHRDAPGSANRGGCLPQLEAGARLIIRHPLADQPLERCIDRAHDLLSRQDLGEMRAADDVAPRDFGKLFHADGDAARLELLHHASVAVPARLLHPGQGCRKDLPVAPDAEAQKVELPGFAFDLDLHAGDEAQAGPLRARARPFQPVEGVVIRQGQCAEPPLERELYELFRRKGSIGRRGMCVQVDHAERHSVVI